MSRSIAQEVRERAVESVRRRAHEISSKLRRTVEFAVKLAKEGKNESLIEAVEFYLAKSYWLNWRIIALLTGVSMDYLTPLDSRVMSFKEFMREWIGAQFIRQLNDYGIEKPWYWDYWEMETNYWHHAFALGLYSIRRTLNFNTRGPSPEERRWLNEKYPDWEENFGKIWDLFIKGWIENNPRGTVLLLPPVLCNMCQVPMVSMKPGRYLRIYQVIHEGRVYNFCSPPCKWIFEEEKERYRGHLNYVDRLLAGKIPLSPEAMRDPIRMYTEITWNMGYTELGEGGADPVNGAWALLYKERDPEFEKRIKERWMVA